VGLADVIAVGPLAFFNWTVKSVRQASPGIFGPR
jgi:hypothetical protein